MNDQEKFWSGEGGDAYLKRNRVDWRLRIPFWSGIIERTGARSVYEFGCNAGWNLSAIRRVHPDVECHGYDINIGAIQAARHAGLNVYDDYALSVRDQLKLPNGPYELVFTCGVLIHIAPENIFNVMKALVEKSYDYVLAVEYSSPNEEMIRYRDQDNLLWKRNYGALYMDMGLELIQKGPAGKGFDNCTYVLLRKP